MSGIEGVGCSSTAYSTSQVNRGIGSISQSGRIDTTSTIVDVLELSTGSQAVEEQDIYAKAAGQARAAPTPTNRQRAASDLTPTQRHLYSPTPDAGFFDDYQAAYGQLDQPAKDGSAPPTSLADVLGATQTEMADLRGVSVEDQRAYARILNQAYSSGGMNDPIRFLQSLSSSDLDVVRRMHGLADPISPGAISDEGATNLLLPEGHSVDFNHDGIDEVGIGKIMHFPPRDAPSGFMDAWFHATKDMDFSDYSLHSMTFLVSFHPPTEAGTVTTVQPTNQLGSYQTIVDNYLDMLDHYRGMLPAGQYERDQPFFSRLKSLLQNA